MVIKLQIINSSFSETIEYQFNNNEQSRILILIWICNSMNVQAIQNIIKICLYYKHSGINLVA